MSFGSIRVPTAVGQTLLPWTAVWQLTEQHYSSQLTAHSSQLTAHSSRRNTVSTEFQVNTDILCDWKPTVVVLNEGAFIVAWYDFSNTLNHDYNIHGQIYDAHGKTNVSALLFPLSLFVIYLKSSLAQAVEGTYDLSPADAFSSTCNGWSSASSATAEILGGSTLIGEDLFVLKCVPSTAKVTPSHQTVGMNESNNFSRDAKENTSNLNTHHVAATPLQVFLPMLVMNIQIQMSNAAQTIEGQTTRFTSLFEEKEVHFNEGSKKAIGGLSYPYEEMCFDSQHFDFLLANNTPPPHNYYDST